VDTVSSQAIPSGLPTSGRVTYQGEAGANSFAACLEVLPGLEPVGCQTFEDAFVAVEAGEADLAMIPVENSIAGRVADIHHLLPESGLHIVAEHFLPIHFQLMVLPGTTLSQIRRVRSHIHALGQCRRIIRDHGWATSIADDTAGAAREVAELGDPTVAALAPTAAASLYGLEIVATDVEDEHHNTTRFLVLSREAVEPEVDAGPAITTFCFRVRNVPAALYKAMGGFATNGVNMTKIESYQLGGTFFATQFYADIEGHPKQTPVSLALEELEFFSVHLRILGTYPAHPFRAAIAEPASNKLLRPTRGH
jgi:prephenate dehydratase